MNCNVLSIDGVVPLNKEFWNKRLSEIKGPKQILGRIE